MTIKEILEKAFREIYPSREIPILEVKYSGKFSDYNANVRIEKEGRKITRLEFGLSKQFQESDESIIIGVVQHLLNKIYKTEHQTMNQEFYHNFIKHIGRYTKNKESSSVLDELFHEINEEYFNGLIDKPTIIFSGNKNLTVLGNYNYHKDLVKISSALENERELSKYVLYHELLHKKHSFKTKNGRGQYHTPAFRADEKKFHDKQIEKKLEKFVRSKKIKEAIFGKTKKNNEKKTLLQSFFR